MPSVPWVRTVCQPCARAGWIEPPAFVLLGPFAWFQAAPRLAPGRGEARAVCRGCRGRILSYHVILSLGPVRETFTLYYDTVSDYRLDLQEAGRTGRLFVALSDPPPIGCFVTILAVLPDDRRFSLDGEVVASTANEGVEIRLAPSDEQMRALHPQFSLTPTPRARSASSGPSRSGSSEQQTPDPPEGAVEPQPPERPASDRPGKAAAAPPIVSRLSGMTTAEKIQIAMHGQRDARAPIMRDTGSRAAHIYVLKNPQLGMDEVTEFARMPHLAADVLSAIASNQTWLGNPAIVFALAKNPRTPTPLAVRLVAMLREPELRAILRSRGVRTAVAHAARKALEGPRK